MKRVLAVALCLAVASAAQAAWIDVGDGFESPGPGNVPDGWFVPDASYLAVNTTDELAFAGVQSAVIDGKSVIRKDMDFAGENEFNFMFYDDMAATKSGRVGLMRAADLTATGGARFGALAVETTSSADYYVAHFGWGFTVTSLERSEGWHHGKISWQHMGGNTVVTMYIDDTQVYMNGHTGELVPQAQYIGAHYGSGATKMWVDSIPEPATLALLALGGMFLRRRRA